MLTTPASLLQRLQLPTDQAAWERFVQLYTPLLLHWAGRLGLRGADAADLVQDVLTLLVRKLPEFHYEPGRGFRAWLRTVATNKWRENLRRRSLPAVRLDRVEEPSAADPVEHFWETEYRQHLVRRALQLMKDCFAPTTWRAFWELVIENQTAPQVAEKLGLTVGAVYAAKVRVLARLREEMAELME